MSNLAWGINCIIAPVVGNTVTYKKKETVLKNNIRAAYSLVTVTERTDSGIAREMDIKGAGAE